MFKMGYEIFSNCAKFSSALVPRIKSDRSFTLISPRGPDKKTEAFTLLHFHSFSFALFEVRFCFFLARSWFYCCSSLSESFVSEFSASIKTTFNCMAPEDIRDTKTTKNGQKSALY